MCRRRNSCLLLEAGRDGWSRSICPTAPAERLGFGSQPPCGSTYEGRFGPVGLACVFELVKIRAGSARTGTCRSESGAADPDRGARRPVFVAAGEQPCPAAGERSNVRRGEGSSRFFDEACVVSDSAVEIESPRQYLCRSRFRFAVSARKSVAIFASKFRPAVIRGREGRARCAPSAAECLWKIRPVDVLRDSANGFEGPGLRTSGRTRIGETALTRPKYAQQCQLLSVGDYSVVWNLLALSCIQILRGVFSTPSPFRTICHWSVLESPQSASRHSLRMRTSFAH